MEDHSGRHLTKAGALNSDGQENHLIDLEGLEVCEGPWAPTPEEAGPSLVMMMKTAGGNLQQSTAQYTHQTNS